ncbi:MAG: molybdopterin-dependent oxidoreductase, partial [Acidimicrobiales bacterium]
MESIENGATASGSDASEGPAAPDKVTHIGRRALLGMVGLSAVGIAVGRRVDSAVGGTLTKVSGALGGLGALVPGANQFRIYTITGTLPTIKPAKYRLRVTGMVDRPLSLSLADLRAMHRTKLVHTFQCVTGWTVPDVHWEGVLLSEVLERAGVRRGATAL